MVAAPMQLGALAANSIASGVTGTMVSVPISVVSGGTAQLVGLIESGRQLLNTNLPLIMLQNSKVVMRPMALMTGSSSVLSGLGLSLVGQGVKTVGNGIERFGFNMASTGNNVKNYGQNLIGWYHGRPYYFRPSDNATDDQNKQQFDELVNMFNSTNLNNVTFALDPNSTQSQLLLIDADKQTPLNFSIPVIHVSEGKSVPSLEQNEVNSTTTLSQATTTTTASPSPTTVEQTSPSTTLSPSTRMALFSGTLKPTSAPIGVTQLETSAPIFNALPIADHF